MGMDKATQDEWDYLVYNWGAAYVFTHDPGQSAAYTARRRDSGQELKANSVESLRTLVRRDYEEHRVPRDFAPK